MNKIKRSRWTKKRLIVLARDGYKCQCCGCDDEKELTIDHIVPKGLLGTDAYSNLQTLCFDCNNAKGCAVKDYRKNRIDEIALHKIKTNNNIKSDEITFLECIIDDLRNGFSHAETFRLISAINDRIAQLRAI